MDGENTSIYRDHFHARSVTSRPHESQTWVKQMWGRMAHDIPEGWRICGENLYAKHSIAYDHLPSFFLGFSVWTDANECLAWDDTLDWFRLLDITPVPLLYDGLFDEKAIRALWTPSVWSHCEGYVVRRADSFSYGEFRTKVGKFVRPRHNQTVPHWRHGQRVEKIRWWRQTLSLIDEQKRRAAGSLPRLSWFLQDGADYAVRSKRSRFITLVQAATKSLANFSFASAEP